MRVHYEKLINPIEQTYTDKSTVENVMFMEDIIQTTNRDIYVQYKKQKQADISYELSAISIDGVIKCKNHPYFINYHQSSYYVYEALDNLVINTVMVKIVNSDLNKGDYTFQIYLNNNMIEEHKYTDQYSLYNRKYIKKYSPKLGTNITITQPLHLNKDEYIKYDVYIINVTEEPSMHKYLCVFDQINNALIFDRKYNDNEISILLQTKGSILRSSTINELYRISNSSFVQFDESANKLILPREKLYKSGSTIKYIKTQSVIIDVNNLNAGYNLIGVYLDNDDILTYEVITYDQSYSTLLSNLKNFQLDVVKKNRDYIGFLIGLNNISKFITTDLQLYNIGTGSGGESGGGGATKLSQDFKDLDSLTIQYGAGSEVPLVEIYDEDGYVVEPESINYNFNDKVEIKFGVNMSGKVSLI